MSTLGLIVRRALLSGLLGVLVCAAPASAQIPDPVSPPTRGALYQDGQTGRYLLGGTWLYRADPQAVGEAQGWPSSTTTDGWSAVSVPSAWNAGDYSPPSNAGAVGWYRRDFTIPPGAFARYVPAAARGAIVRFESVNYRATVWLNGQLVGRHTGMNLPFELTLPPLRAGRNQLVVEVDNRRTPSDIPPGPGAGWWNFGGILREVYLRPVQRADVSQVVVRPLLRCPSCAARIQEQATIRNLTGTPQSVALRGRYGQVPLSFGRRTIPPHGTWTASASAVIPKPRLWSIDRPYLYRATVALTDSKGRAIGGYLTLSGIRSIRVTPDGRLTLNGRLLNLRGAEVREQSLTTGTALSPAQLAALVGGVRALGAKVIRADPLDPEIPELADRYGLLIWSDINVNQNVSDAELSQPAFQDSARAMLRQNILTNENHPSLMVWSIANELPTPATPNEAAYVAAAVAQAHRLDPTRPVGMAVSDWPGVACQPAYAPLDVIGINEYFGWFDAGGGQTDDRENLSPFLDSVRACYPTQGLFVTEFGFDANRDGPADERGTYGFQSDAAAFHARVFDSKPWLTGAMYFILQDAATFPNYSGGNPYPDPPFDEKGLTDVHGNLKPAFGVLSAIYRAVQQIAPAQASSAARRVPASR